MNIEASLGAEMFAAFSLASMAHAYQINKAGKDGLHLVAPGNEMLLHSVFGRHSSDEYNDTSLSESFTANNIRLGSAG